LADKQRILKQLEFKSSKLSQERKMLEKEIRQMRARLGEIDIELTELTKKLLDILKINQF
jgi:predicted nuclease with TOPRIM domain